MDVGSDLLRRALKLLMDGGVRCWVFGGWAEELQGLRPARAHSDIDLLCVADDFSAVDVLLGDHPLLREIQSKRFAHKRAFELEGTRVELFLVEHDTKGYFTTFWGCVRHDWPPDVLSSASQLPVASVAALTGYRDQFSALRRERQQHERAR